MYGPTFICRRNTFSHFHKQFTFPPLAIQSYNDIVVIIIDAFLSNYIIEVCATIYRLVFLRPVKLLVPLLGSTLFSVRTWCLGTGEIWCPSEGPVTMRSKMAEGPTATLF